MVNEGELLERFGIQIVPITLIEIGNAMEHIIKSRQAFIESEIRRIRRRVSCNSVNNVKLSKIAAMKHAIKEWSIEQNLSAVAIQCWSAMQDAFGIMPCYINSELAEEFLPVACETDIHGAVTAALTQAACMGRTPVFFADVTIRHPENDNAELLWHCGPFPYSLKKDGSEASIGEHYILDSKCPGINEWEIKGGSDISICRFDGDNGQYRLFAAKGRGIEGPKTRGTYVWIEFKDWPRIEKTLIFGPYIHHVAGIHENVIPVLKEAVRYMPGIDSDIIE
jgi:L-fucose isomerase-like protein